MHLNSQTPVKEPGHVKLVTTKFFLLGSTLYFQNSHDFITGGRGYLVIKNRNKKPETKHLTLKIFWLSVTHFRTKASFALTFMGILSNCPLFFAYDNISVLELLPPLFDTSKLNRLR